MSGDTLTRADIAAAMARLSPRYRLRVPAVHPASREHLAVHPAYRRGCAECLRAWRDIGLAGSV